MKLKQDAKKYGIETKDFYEFFQFMSYCKKLALHQAVNKDQVLTQQRCILA